jgi:hypothetical protein
MFQTQRMATPAELEIATLLFERALEEHRIEHKLAQKRRTPFWEYRMIVSGIDLTISQMGRRGNITCEDWRFVGNMVEFDTESQFSKDLTKVMFLLT